MAKRSTLAGATVAAAACAGFVVIAGDLAPPAGGVSPTHKTLTEVEPRIPIHQSDIPLSITIAGSYCLVENLHAVGVGSPVITVQSDDVMIDLRGFTIHGASEVAQASAGVLYQSGDNLVVMNGTIRDCIGPGVGFEVGADGAAVLERLRILDNTEQGVNLPGSFVRMSHCSVINNGDIGVGATLLHMRDCLVQGNGQEGVVAFDGLVQSNVVVGNGGTGNIAMLSGTVIENRAP